MEKKEFVKLILNDEYIEWLASFVNQYGEFDDCYFAHNSRGVLKEKDIVFIDCLSTLFDEINKYGFKNGITFKNTFCYVLKYNEKLYEIFDNGDCYCCKIGSENTETPVIDYNQFKKMYQKNMQVNFELLKERVVDSLNNTDLDFIGNELSKLNEPTLFSGVGGSSVVSEFGAKVVNNKNGIVSVNSEPRDFLYRNNSAFRNVVACSYCGNNYGVELSFLKNLRKYLLSNNSFDDNDITYLKYSTTIDKERSFISLGATLIPASILMDYYLNGKNSLMLDCIEETSFDFDLGSDVYEIFSGYDTSTASKYLESTMVESGIGIPIVHDKYSYCHGRSTLGINYNAIAIYYNRNTEFDRMMLEELKKYYSRIITIDSKYEDQILDDYQMLIQSMYLTKYIAEKKNVDLSDVKYCQIVKKLYKYKGEI